MSEKTLILCAMFTIVAVVAIPICRWQARMEFRAGCYWQRVERLRKQTGWEPLDEINAALYVLHRRLHDHA
jgi:hypothetical protein